MKRVDAEISATICLAYNPESGEFKEALKCYREMISDEANEENMIASIVSHIATQGCESLIEGVGYVSVDGEKKGDPEEWCGVDIVDNLNINDTPEFSVDLIYISNE